MKYLFCMLITCFAVFLVINCAPEEGDTEVLDGSGDISQASWPIYNGNPPDAPEHHAVISLHQLAKGGTAVYVMPFCSGTLIATDVVITAAHCLDVAKPGKTSFVTIGPDKLAIYVGDNPSVDIVDHLYRVSQTVIYPGYNRRAIRNDIALIHLQQPITEPVAPVPNLPASIGFTPADVGSLLNIAGFGETEDGTSGVKLQVDVPLGSLGCTIDGCPDPGDAATQIAYEQNIGGPCFGDSGGPAFFYRSGVAYVGGLTSYGDSYCTIYGVSTRVDAFQTWIDEFVNPPPPPDCSADGYCNPACAVGADPDCASTVCGNGICENGESCDGRHSTIACLADCPGKLGGKPASRYCYVGDTCEGPACP